MKKPDSRPGPPCTTGPVCGGMGGHGGTDLPGGTCTTSPCNTSGASGNGGTGGNANGGQAGNGMRGTTNGPPVL
jgi:hypothetical protein